MSRISLYNMCKKWVGLAILLMTIPLAVTSCSGGGGGGGGSAGGGIGGTGVYAGVISGFGSVFVNGVEFDTTGALITVDDSIATENDLEVGMRVEIEAANSIAETIVFESEVKGPVENIDLVNNTLVVMGQNVIVDSTTIFNGVTGIVDLQVGNEVKVSGFFDANGDIRATFIELLTQPLLEFEVKGVVLNLDTNAQTFDISGLTVDYSGVQNPPGINDGSFVEVKGNNLQGGILFATELEIEDPLPTGNPGDEMEIDGIITQFTSTSDFEVNGQRVQTNAMTTFKNGAASDIALNVRVEVEGTVDNNGILIAEEVEFRFHADKDVEIEGRVEVIDTLNSTVTVFGITVTVDSSTVFKDDSQQQLSPFTLGDIQPGDFLEIGGFINNGDVLAAKLERENDPPGPGEDSLKGPVDQYSENPPVSFEILGVSVDVSGPWVTFENEDGSTINDANTFFNTIDDTKDPGDIVEVKGNFAGGVLTADEVEIEQIN